jgi:hypothetical protein
MPAFGVMNLDTFDRFVLSSIVICPLVVPLCLVMLAAIYYGWRDHRSTKAEPATRGPGDHAPNSDTTDARTADGDGHR